MNGGSFIGTPALRRARLWSGMHVDDRLSRNVDMRCPLMWCSSRAGETRLLLRRLVLLFDRTVSWRFRSLRCLWTRTRPRGLGGST